jgi:ABC-2 type transport system ATP-binding protein
MARMSGLPATAARERAADTLRHVGLYEERYRPIGGYSTGMRQRVKLAQSLVHDPRLVLLDEPTNGLDPAGRDEMLGLIRRIGTEFGISVLVTSHLLGELERICDHVVIIDGGRLLRSQAVATFTEASGVLVVEVDEGTEKLGVRLTQAGLQVRPEGRFLLVDIAGETTFDAIRDAVAEMDLGLIRMEQRRHHIEEVFAAGGPEL